MYTKSELSVLRQIGKGCTDMECLPAAVKLSKSATYAAVRGLKTKGVLEKGKGLDIVPSPYNVRMTALVSSSVNAVDLLSDSGLDMLSNLRGPKTVSELMSATGLSRATVYRRLGDAMDSGAVSYDGARYSLNDTLWPDLRRFFDSMDDQLDTVDPRVRAGSTIFHRDGSEVVYGSPVVQGHQRTAFSYFEDQGFPAGFSTAYYTTRIEPVTEDRAFDDAFNIAMKDGDHRLRLMVMLYYLIHRDNLSVQPRAEHLIEAIEEGVPVAGWPDWDEVLRKGRDLGVTA